MKNKKDIKSWLIYIGIGVGVVLVLFLSISVIPKALVVLTKASSSNRVSTISSYLIGERILAKADGKDKCIVNVFLLDKSGKGVSGRVVDLIGADRIINVSNVSDETGKLTFEIVSAIEGQFELRAISNGIELPQTVKVTFRK